MKWNVRKHEIIKFARENAPCILRQFKIRQLKFRKKI